MEYYEIKGMKFIEENSDYFYSVKIIDNIWYNTYIIFGWTTTWKSKNPIEGWYNVTAKDFMND